MFLNILDASALLALIKKEHGWQTVEKLLLGSEKNITSVFIHAINYTEFLYKCEKIFGPAKTNMIIADFEQPFFGVVNYWDKNLSFFTANLKANYHLSLADATGLAHTKIMNGTFWTADAALEKIAAAEEIKLRLIRPT